MASGKKYYWIKLKDSFMASDVMDYLIPKSREDGIEYLAIYIMFCLTTANTEGKFFNKIGDITVPYDVKKMRYACRWFSEEEIAKAIELFFSLRLIDCDEEGVPVIADFENLVGCETDAAARMRSSRASHNKVQTDDVTDDEQCSNNVTPDIRDKRIDIRDKRSDIRDQSTEKRQSMSEQSPDCSRPAATTSEFYLSLNTGKRYNVSPEELGSYKELYPGVNVEQELRSMEGWLRGNPKRRKTEDGIQAFIHRWLKKTQDEGGTHKDIACELNHLDTRPQPKGNPFADVPDDDYLDWKVK